MFGIVLLITVGVSGVRESPATQFFQEEGIETSLECPLFDIMVLIAVGVSGVSGHIVRPSVLHSFKGRVVKSLLNGLCLVSHVLLRVARCSPLCLGYHSTETRAVSLGHEVSH